MEISLGHAADRAKDFNYGIANIFSKSGNGAHTPIDALFNDSGWTALTLPHDWAVALPFVKAIIRISYPMASSPLELHTLAVVLAGIEKPFHYRWQIACRVSGTPPVRWHF